MANVLVIKSSILGEDGTSSKLVNEFNERWQSANPEDIVTTRDLASNPIPHLDPRTFFSLIVPAAERTPEQAEAAHLADEVIEEFMAADVIAFGVPMYNLGIPSTLKSYFDYIARVGVTFKYTEAGAVGLAGNKKVYVFISRGGIYTSGEGDFQIPYIKAMLNFVGIEDIRFVIAEGLNINSLLREEATARAMTEVREMV